MGRPWKHRLSQIDEAKEQGMCSACGWVDLYWSPCLKRWKCRNKRRDDKRRRYTRLYQKHPRKPSGKHSKKYFAKRRGKVCEICGSMKTPCADHDHETDTFRGTLCGTCNTGLGMFKDSVELLSNAISYLNAKRATTP